MTWPTAAVRTWSERFSGTVQLGVGEKRTLLRMRAEAPFPVVWTLFSGIAATGNSPYYLTALWVFTVGLGRVRQRYYYRGSAGTFEEDALPTYGGFQSIRVPAETVEIELVGTPRFGGTFGPEHVEAHCSLAPEGLLATGGTVDVGV